MNTIEARGAAVTPSAPWPTKQEAADALGVTTKTLEKYVKTGRLNQRMEPQINKPARAVIDPEALSRMLAERQSQNLPERSQNLPEQVALTRSQNIPELFQMLAGGRELPPSELAHKLYLTEEEAVRYTGLGRGQLAGAAKRGPRGAKVYRRVDLEAL